MKNGFQQLTFLLLLFAISGNAFNQTPLLSQIKLPQVAPPSPDAAAIEKFGNFPDSGVGQPALQQANNR